MKHNESGIPSSNKPTTLVVGYKEDVIADQLNILDITQVGHIQGETKFHLYR
ncbi:MAG: hypothetical protein WC613_06180 [Candidatus Aenigmatarchaeota archaeon]